MATRKRVAKRQPQIDDWEASLIKAMLADGRWSKQDIHAYFSHPERPINQARISQIASGVIRADVLPASKAQLDAFLRGYRDRAAARSAFLEQDPLHPVSLGEVLHVKLGGPSVVEVEESEAIEFKETFSWNNRALYARTLAGFANNRGGYLVFGIKDETKEIVGLHGAAFAALDIAEASMFLDATFAPSMRFNMRAVILGGVEIGVIYVWQAIEKPVVCTRSEGGLKAADIYYRYVGSSSRIKYPELAQLLAARDRRVEEKWIQKVSRVREIGVDDAAIVDLRSGVVTGSRGTFIIDEALLPKLTFVREGEFTEKAGAPTLKLIGDVEPVRPVVEKRIERVPLNEREIVAAFVERRRVEDPIAYVRQLCHVQAAWLPIYYFIAQSGRPIDEVRAIVAQEQTSYPVRRERQVERLTRNSRRASAPSARTNKLARDRILARGPFAVEERDEALAFLKAVQTLSAIEMDREYLMPLLRACFERHWARTDLAMQIRYATSDVDFELWGRLLLKGSGRTSGPRPDRAAAD